jgi:hypothetical protein
MIVYHIVINFCQNRVKFAAIEDAPFVTTLLQNCSLNIFHDYTRSIYNDLHCNVDTNFAAYLLHSYNNIVSKARFDIHYKVFISLPWDLPQKLICGSSKKVVTNLRQTTYWFTMKFCRDIVAPFPHVCCDYWKFYCDICHESILANFAARFSENIMANFFVEFAAIYPRVYREHIRKYCSNNFCTLLGILPRTLLLFNRDHF